jgi:hypothetical protein
MSDDLVRAPRQEGDLSAASVVMTPAVGILDARHSRDSRGFTLEREHFERVE